MRRRHRPLILNGLKAKGRISNGIVESLNNKAKLRIRKSYGFRFPDILEMAFIMRLASFLSRSSPMNFTEEPKKSTEIGELVLRATGRVLRAVEYSPFPTRPRNA